VSSLREKIGSQFVAQFRLLTGEVENASRVLDDIGVRVVIVRLQYLPARLLAAVL